MQLRHAGKVHAVPADQQRQRQEDRRHDGQDLHDAVLPDVDLRLEQRLDLRAVFAQQLRFLAQADDALFKQSEQSALLVRKVAVLVFPQLARHVVELGVIAVPGHRLLAQLAYRGAELLQLAREHAVLQRRRAVLDLLEAVQVLGDQQLKEVVEEAPGAVFCQAFFLDNTL